MAITKEVAIGLPPSLQQTLYEATLGVSSPEVAEFRRKGREVLDSIKALPLESPITFDGPEVVLEDHPYGDAYDNTRLTHAKVTSGRTAEGEPLIVQLEWDTVRYYGSDPHHYTENTQPRINIALYPDGRTYLGDIRLSEELTVTELPLNTRIKLLEQSAIVLNVLKRQARQTS